MLKTILSFSVLAIAVTANAQLNSSMAREFNFAPQQESYVVNDEGTSQVILPNYKSEEILVVVQDIMGNDLYSKIVFQNNNPVLKAIDPYNNIPSGVYTVVATSRNEIFNQKIVID
jgi:hypothetical protein